MIKKEWICLVFCCESSSEYHPFSLAVLSKKCCDFSTKNKI